MLVVLTYGFMECSEGDGNGLTPLASKIESFFGADVKIMEWQDDLTGFIANRQYTPPLVLIGHSFGGSATVRTADQLMDLGINVDMMILLDPVPTNGWLIPKRSAFVLSNNVSEAICFHRGAMVPPWSRPIVSALGLFTNYQWDLGHSEFNHDPKVHEVILKAIKRTEDTYKQLESVRTKIV